LVGFWLLLRLCLQMFPRKRCNEFHALSLFDDIVKLVCPNDDRNSTKAKPFLKLP